MLGSCSVYGRETMRVGWIGLGGIGKPMAMNVLKSGFDLTVNDLQPDPVRELQKLGARVAANAREVAEGSDIVLASLPSNEASEEVALGPDGVLAGAKAGSIYVELSTISPDVVHKIARQAQEGDAAVLDAPVSGGIAARRDGNLSIMAGGEADVLARAMPVLQTFGSRIFHAGPSGSGATVKLVNNLLAGINMVATMEAMVLGVKAGLTVETLKEVVSASSGNSGIFQSLVDTVMQQSPNPPNGQVANQGLHTIGKDVQLAVDLARRHAVPLPLGSPASQVFLSGMARGWADREYWSIIQIFEEMSAVRVRPADF